MWTTSPKNKADLQPLQSTLCSMCLQVFLCDFGLILLFDLDIKTGLAEERGPSVA